MREELPLVENVVPVEPRSRQLLVLEVAVARVRHLAARSVMANGLCVQFEERLKARRVTLDVARYIADAVTLFRADSYWNSARFVGALLLYA